MIRFRNLLRAIPYFAILLMCGEAAHAAPILLVEFTHNGFALRAGQTPATVPFSFAASDSPPLYFVWEDNYRPSDVGITFAAPAEIVMDAIQAIHSPTAAHGTTMAGISVQSYEPSTVACGPCNILVPVMKWPEFTLASVERIIDRLVITGFSETYNVTGRTESDSGVSKFQNRTQLRAFSLESRHGRS